jgi:dephospho-CoA kinase
MLKVALTGGIGTGKTHVRARFEARGVPAIDADAVVHEALGPGTAVSSDIEALFGPSILTADGAVDRRRLGAIVFADAAARRSLERVVHPVVFAAISAWFAGFPPGGSPNWGLADVPLLFEVRREWWFDKVVVAACAATEQVRRVMARDALTEAQAKARMAAQWPIAEKVLKADYVVWTDRGADETDRQVGEIYRLLTTVASLTP